MPLYSQDQQQVALVSSASASSGGYVISAQPSPVIPGLVRPMQQVPHMAGQGTCTILMLKVIFIFLFHFSAVHWSTSVWCLYCISTWNSQPTSKYV